MPTVSAVLSSYNYGAYISQAIESVLAQSFDDLELIIVDDASVDDSRQIIERYARADSRIRTKYHSENLGVSKTINDGWSMARGKFIANISADDMWMKDKLESQVKVLEKDEDLVVWSEGEIIDGKGAPTGELFTHIHGAAQRKKSGGILAELLKGNFILASSRIFKRQNLQGRNYNESLKHLGDYQFAVDMAKDYDYYFFERPLAKYRIHGKNTVQVDLAGHYRDSIALNRYFLQTYGRGMSNDTKIKVMYSLFCGMILSPYTQYIMQMNL